MTHFPGKVGTRIVGMDEDLRLLLQRADDAITESKKLADQNRTHTIESR